MGKKDKNKKKKKADPAKIEKKLRKLDSEMKKSREKMHRMNSKLARMDIQDYALKDQDGKDVNLSALFGNKKDLVLIHNMGKSCSYCTLWADGFNGVYYFIQKKAAFALVSPDPPDVQKSFADERGWKFPMYSGHGSAFIKDMGYETDKGEFWPGASVFRKDKDGKITRTNKTFFGPGDLYCSVFHFFDMLPGKE